MLANLLAEFTVPGMRVNVHTGGAHPRQSRSARSSPGRGRERRPWDSGESRSHSERFEVPCSKPRS